MKTRNLFAIAALLLGAFTTTQAVTYDHILWASPSSSTVNFDLSSCQSTVTGVSYPAYLNISFRVYDITGLEGDIDFNELTPVAAAFYGIEYEGGETRGSYENLGGFTLNYEDSVGDWASLSISAPLEDGHYYAFEIQYEASAGELTGYCSPYSYDAIIQRSNFCSSFYGTVTW